MMIFMTGLSERDRERAYRSIMWRWWRRGAHSAVSRSR